MRESVHKAYERLQRHRRKAGLRDGEASKDDDNTEGTARLFTAHDVAPPNVRLFIKIDYHHDARGVSNAMQILIEENGLESLQRLGVASSCDGTYMQGLYVKEIARVAKMYEITTYVLMPADAASNKVEHLQAQGVIVELIPENEFRNDSLLASTIARIGAYRFSAHHEADVVHGQGTVALELEEEVEKLLELEASAQDDGKPAGKGKLDAIISVMGNGSTLCGICMASQGTGMRIFGAETVPGPVSEDLPRDQEGSCNHWQHFRPMGSLPWSIFTSPRMLSAVLYVDQKAAELASEKLFEQHGIRVRPYDAAPLGLVLYSEDFRHSAAKDAESDGVRNIGLILRSDFPRIEAGKAKLGTAQSDTDLEEFFKNWHV
ncbi:hypothetical protein Q7P37_010933 [Cladosporium fusiforme]